MSKWASLRSIYPRHCQDADDYWYDYAKPKCEDKATACFKNTDSCIVHIKSEDLHACDLAEEVEIRFYKSNFQVDRPLPIGKKESDQTNKRWIRWKNNERVCYFETRDVSLAERWWLW